MMWIWLLIFNVWAALAGLWTFVKHGRTEVILGAAVFVVASVLGYIMGFADAIARKKRDSHLEPY